MAKLLYLNLSKKKKDWKRAITTYHFFCLGHFRDCGQEFLTSLRVLRRVRRLALRLDSPRETRVLDLGNVDFGGIVWVSCLPWNLDKAGN